MSKRILLFTGKGGVGKTTCAAATALESARRGQRTLIMSSDPAHSLADALDTTLGPEPVEVQPNFFAQEVDLYYSMRKYWGNVRQLMLAVFKWQGVNEIAAEELAALPGMGEASALLWLDKFYHDDQFDVIIVDSAPTGETLTFLTLPQVTQWWLTKAFPFQKLAIKSVGLGVRTTTGIPLDRGYDELNALFDRLRIVQQVLSDPDISSVRLVTNPERMVIREARRAYTYLQLYGYVVDAVLVNRVLPPDEVGSLMQPYVQQQAAYLDEIETSFSPLPIFHVPHLGREVFGLPLLGQIGAELYGDRDPTAVFHREPTYEVRAENDAYVLRLHMPFLEADDVEAHHFGDQLVVQVANQRRNYLLPSFLSYYRLADTHLQNGWLQSRFVQGEAA